MNHKESQLQQACVKWFRLKYPKYAKLLFAVPNGGARSATTARILMGEGVLAGVSDLLLMVTTIDYIGMAIEMKVHPNKLTPKQKEWLDLVEEQGYEVFVCYDFDSFIEKIDDYMFSVMYPNIDIYLPKKNGTD